MSDSSHALSRNLSDLDEISRLLTQLAMLMEENNGPEAATADYVRAWLAPEHDQAVQAVQRIRARLAPQEPGAIRA